ncbi:MAG: UDP-N-acetylmuramoyl-L-alanyl-D-glutamate--2,6-diaminopimelate ligase [Candidatus Cloacimonadota bacterium]|nr:MAG: UDP-N-acetylmuramoyl-L-alanyl-D-glutamate--2,6-diaminopimelate ligase [Candidatus Cloacimonadota bacterium]
MRGKSRMQTVRKFYENLRKHIDVIDAMNINDSAVEYICSDSRKAAEKSIFVCISGFSSDGHDFALKAVENGASLIIAERPIDTETPQIIVKNSREAAAWSAKIIFNDPTEDFYLIGITGTNGKTSTAAITEKILRNAGHKTGLIGTLGYSIDGKKYNSERTTPDIVELNEIFDKMRNAGIEVVVMEVSSHALDLHRVTGLEFDSGIFTNLSREHLDFHKNMFEYKNAKFKLFKDFRLKNAIINSGDEAGKELSGLVACDKICLKPGDNLKILQTSAKSTDFIIENFSGETSGKFSVPLTGDYNAVNAASAISAAKIFDPELSVFDLNSFLLDINIPGRLEKVENYCGIHVFVDYAHTPDALENVLGCLAKVKKNRIITVFGAGGDRDKSKRPFMLDKALLYSDLTIVTSDNPRTENPNRIIADIIGDHDPEENFWINSDRRCAIYTALKSAVKDDIVLIAGKGHETYQEINGKKFRFDDREEAKKILNSRDDVLFEKAHVCQKLALPVDLLEIRFLLGDLSFLNSRQLFYVSTDSRILPENSFFVALKGDVFDGNNFVKDAISNPSVCCIASDCDIKSEQIVRVEDTTNAYQKIASKYRSLFTAKVIGVTGSFGKTTTKEILSNILSRKGNVLKSFRNENNQVGVPKTLFALSPSLDYLILEMGANKFGEIELLASASKPEIGIITSVGNVHTAFLRNKEGVFKEKSSLLKHVSEIAFVTGDFDKFYDAENVETVGFSLKSKHRVKIIESVSGETTFMLDDKIFTVNSPADFFALNASFAVKTAQYLKFTDEDIAEGLKLFSPEGNRMKIIEAGENIIIADCYNAGPESMKAGIEHWRNNYAGIKHVAVLGDMLELGEKSKYFHEEIGKFLTENERNNSISVGSESKYYNLKKHCRNVDELIENFKPESCPVVYFVKASRRIKLEKFIELLLR